MADTKELGSVPPAPRKTAGKAGKKGSQEKAASGNELAVADDARRTVIMKAEEAAAALPEGAQGPPKVELVVHELPDDAPLDKRLVLVREPDSERAAAFRILRHHLLELDHPQVIAVSGPRDGCGKTTTAVNLALALAERGRGAVLLIDGNLRHPELAGIFRFIPPWCFGEQLAQHREQPFLPWGFVDVSQLWLHIAAINPRNHGQTRLDAPAFAIAMERLRHANYDHIVIDCPSVLGHADVNLIQDAADGVLLCARTKKGRTRDIERAVDQLSPTKILGTALLE